MSPRLKSDNSKRNRFEIRLNDQMLEILEECSKNLNIKKTEVINKGILMVKSEIDKKKSSCNPTKISQLLNHNPKGIDKSSISYFLWKIKKRRMIYYGK